MNHRGGRPQRTVEVYMDASPPTLERRREVMDHLESLVQEGALGQYTVRTWPRRVVLDGPNRDVETVFHRFRRWADDHGVSVERTFDRRPHAQRITGERGELLSPPVVAVAIYEDGDLVTVAPHDDGAVRRTVDETLTALAEDIGPTAVPH